MQMSEVVATDPVQAPNSVDRFPCRAYTAPDDTPWIVSNTMRRRSSGLNGLSRYPSGPRVANSPTRSAWEYPVIITTGMSASCSWVLTKHTMEMVC